MLSTAGLGAGHGGFIFHMQKMMICVHVVRTRLPHTGQRALGLDLPLQTEVTAAGPIAPLVFYHRMKMWGQGKGVGVILQPCIKSQKGLYLNNFLSHPDSRLQKRSYRSQIS